MPSPCGQGSIPGIMTRPVQILEPSVAYREVCVQIDLNLKVTLTVGELIFAVHPQESLLTLRVNAGSDLTSQVDVLGSDLNIQVPKYQRRATTCAETTSRKVDQGDHLG